MSDYQERDPEVEVILKKLGNVLGESMPKNHGFTLLIWTKGQGGNIFYISNGNRQDVIATMKEFIEKNTH